MNYPAEASKIAHSMLDRGLFPWQAKDEVQGMNQYAPFEKEKLVPLVEKELRELRPH